MLFMKKLNHSITLSLMARLKLSLLPILALGLTTGAWGEPRIDPTIVPPAWLAAQPSKPGAETSVTKGTAPRVQLIVIGKSRRFAVIDGQVVRSGEVFNESRIVVIKSGEVVTEDKSKSLKLNPSVEKKVIAPTSLRKANDGPKKRKSSTKASVIVNGSN